MSELRELYQETIIDHGRNPRNFGKLRTTTHHHEGFNPLCGDKILLHLYKEGHVIQHLAFEGTGCAIAMASASLLTEMLMGKTIAEIEEIANCFQQFVTGQAVTSEKLGKLIVLGGVAEFPARVKCATLAWHTLNAALKNETGIVTTEKTL